MLQDNLINETYKESFDKNIPVDFKIEAISMGWRTLVVSLIFGLPWFFFFGMSSAACDAGCPGLSGEVLYLGALYPVVMLLLIISWIVSFSLKKYETALKLILLWRKFIAIFIFLPIVAVFLSFGIRYIMI